MAPARDRGATAAAGARALPGAPTTKAARHARIADVLTREQVHSQQELAALLADEGFTVTQATLSRDLDELGAVRLRSAGGGFVYVVPTPDDAARARAHPTGGDQSAPGSAGHARLLRIAAELLLSAQASGNLVVARTPPGGAHLLAGALDQADLPAIIGTVAGDDTVLCICREPDGGPAVAEQLLGLADRRAAP